MKTSIQSTEYLFNITKSNVTSVFSMGLLTVLNILKIFSYFHLCVCVQMGRYVYVHEYRCPQKPEEDTGFPGAEVVGDCEVLGTKLKASIRVVRALNTEQSLQIPH